MSTDTDAGPTGFGFSSTAEEVTEGVDLTGKVAVITGVNSGLGEETMRVLAKRGATIIGLARTQEKAQTAMDNLGIAGTALACELSDFASVAAAADAIKASGQKIDMLICNAGIMALPKLNQKNGIELQFYTNHLGHFLLVNKLMDQLAPQARIVILSSNAHFAAPESGIEFDNLSGERDYEPVKAYGQSKLANILFAKELTNRRNGRDYTANALHPGVIRTNLGRNMTFWTIAKMSVRVLFSGMKFKNVQQGAATTCYVAANPGAAGISGEYWDSSNVAEPLPHAKDAAMAAKLWQVSEELVKDYL